MNEIDWSKVPERATHFAPENEKYLAAFWRIEDGKGLECWPIMKDGRIGHYKNPTFDPDEFGRMIARPSAWDGQGLPPVGTECEWTGTKGGFWMRSTVVAVNDRQVVVQHAKDDEYRPGEFDVRNINSTTFRRIRTDAEVLAEHQKAMAIGAMLEMIDGLDLREACQVLYEDDYRKVEIGDREETIETMRAITDVAGPGVSAKLAALYDAGYRKVES